MNHSLKRNDHTIYIFLADGFDELPVAQALAALRRPGGAVSLAAIRPGLVHGADGLTIRPDVSLADLSRLLTASEDVRLILLPGNDICASKLLADPRVHRYIGHVIQTGGYVAVLTGAEGVLLETADREIHQADHLLLQGLRPTLEFIEYVAACIT